MNGTRASAYAARFSRVYDYIDQHLDDELSLERLSVVAHFSRFHFHRQFTEYTGITLGRYIQLRRLKRASYRLAFEKDQRIIDIALEAQFENPESFSRAFKHAFGQTPSQFRHEPDWPAWYRSVQIRKPATEGQPSMEITIVDFKPTRVAVLEHRKSPKRIDESVDAFREWRRQSGLSPVESSNTYGVVYNDPETTPEDEFMFDLCGEVSNEVPQNSHNIINGRINGGRCAVLRHSGSLTNIGDKVRYLYGSWLPDSGEELRDAPCFFHYLNVSPSLDEHELQTDIYLPLK